MHEITTWLQSVARRKPHDASGMLVMPDQERAATLRRIRAFLERRPETSGELTLPMLTGVLRARRR